MKRLAPPGPFRVWSLGGLCPVEGIGQAFDRRGWYFRAEGRLWRFGIGAVKGRRRYRTETRWDGDGLDCVLASGDGWYAQGLWPEPGDRAWRRHELIYPSPASYMPEAVAADLIADLLRQYERGALPRRVKIQLEDRE